MRALREALATVGRILRHPVLFFRSMPQTGGLSVPLAFALGVRWVVRLVEYFLGGVRGRPAAEIVESFRGTFGLEPGGWGSARGEVLEWVLGAGNVLADPFYSLARILVSALLLYLGAALLVPVKVRYEAVVRILCASQVAVVFSWVPGIGFFIAGVYTFILSVIGLREVFQISTARATVIAATPAVVLAGVVLWVALFSAILVLGLVSVLI